MLQERTQPLQTVGEFSRDGIEIHAATLLEISELRNLEAVEHNLPPDAPGAERRRLPVILFKLDVRLAQINADRAERLEVKLLHILRRRLQDHLQLQVLEQAVGILPITPISRTPRRLNISNLIRIRPKHAKECLRSHGPGAHFNVIRLLNNRPALSVKGLELEDEFLERQRIGFG